MSIDEHKMIKLGDVATYVNGYAFKPADRGDVGLPIIRIQDLTGNAYDLGFYNGKYPEKIEINDGDVLISWSASLGVYIWDRGKALLNQHIFKVVFDKIDIDKNYFVYAVKRKISEMGMKTHGATMKHIIKKDFDATLIPYPPKVEQLCISNKLNTICRIIELRKQELQRLDELIKARFVEMFGNPFETSKWSVKKLNVITESMVDGSNVNPDYYEAEGEVLFLRIQNVWRNEFKLDDSVYISQEINHEQYYDTSLITGDLLITKIGRYYTKDSSLGRVAVYRGENDAANYSNNIMRVRLSDSMNSEFVNALLNLDDYQAFIKRTSKGGTDKRALSKSLIGSYPIIIPPKKLQDQFAAFVAEVDKSKLMFQKLHQKLNILQQKAGDI